MSDAYRTIMATPQAESGRQLLGLLGVILEPVREYGRAFAGWAHPERIARRIAADEIDFPALVKLMLACAVVTALISSVLPAQGGEDLEFVKIPLLNDLFVVYFFVVVGLLQALTVYKPLRWVHGTGSFKHTFIAAVYSVISVLPMLMMLEGIFALVRTSSHSDSASAALITWYFSRLAAHLHAISIWRAFAAIIAASAGAGLILGVLIAVVRGLV